jgi:hypothetical protein
VDRKINNHFIFNMSSEDHKTFASPTLDEKPHGRQQIDQYLAMRNEKIQQSVLYNTFHQLNCERMRQVSETFKREQLSKLKHTGFPFPH